MVPDHRLKRSVEWIEQYPVKKEKKNSLGDSWKNCLTAWHIWPQVNKTTWNRIITLFFKYLYECLACSPDSVHWRECWDGVEGPCLLMYQTVSASHIKDTVLSNGDAKFNKSWVFFSRSSKSSSGSSYVLWNDRSTPDQKHLWWRTEWKYGTPLKRGRKPTWDPILRSALPSRNTPNGWSKFSRYCFLQKMSNIPLKPLFMPFSKSTLPHKRGGGVGSKGMPSL